MLNQLYYSLFLWLKMVKTYHERYFYTYFYYRQNKSSPFVKTIRRKVSFSLGVLTQNGMKYYFKKYIGLLFNTFLRGLVIYDNQNLRIDFCNTKRDGMGCGMEAKKKRKTLNFKINVFCIRQLRLLTKPSSSIYQRIPNGGNQHRFIRTSFYSHVHFFCLTDSI